MHRLRKNPATEENAAENGGGEGHTTESRARMTQQSRFPRAEYLRRRVRLAPLLAAAVLLTLGWQSAWADVRLLYYPDDKLKARVSTRVNRKGEILRHGGFQRFHPNGRIALQGKYHDNEPVGIWSWWNEDGHLIRRVRYDGRFQEVLVGKQLEDPDTTFSNTAGRKVAQGRMKFDKGHGAWSYWFDDGSPKASGKFVTGIPDGRWVLYYPNGQLKSIEEYRLGILHGVFMKAHPNGQEKVEGRLEHGMKIGRWRHWYANGQLRSRGAYENDLEEGEWRFWDKGGTLTKRLAYQAGRPVRELALPTKPPKREPVIPYADQERLTLPRLYDDAGRKIVRQDFVTPPPPPPPKRGSKRHSRSRSKSRSMSR